VEGGVRSTHPETKGKEIGLAESTNDNGVDSAENRQTAADFLFNKFDQNKQQRLQIEKKMNYSRKMS
jgi:hypothetical protein